MTSVRPGRLEAQRDRRRWHSPPWRKEQRMTDAGGVTFKTTVASTGNNTGIEVPSDVIERLGRGKRPPVFVDVNGYQYRSTVGVMGGKHLIGISAAVREETGLAAGAPITVTLRVAGTPREVQVPDDFAEALGSNPKA